MDGMLHFAGSPCLCSYIDGQRVMLTCTTAWPALTIVCLLPSRHCRRSCALCTRWPRSTATARCATLWVSEECTLLPLCRTNGADAAAGIDGAAVVYSGQTMLWVVSCTWGKPSSKRPLVFSQLQRATCWRTRRDSLQGLTFAFLVILTLYVSTLWLIPCRGRPAGGPGGQRQGVCRVCEPAAPRGHRPGRVRVRPQAAGVRRLQWTPGKAVW